MGTAATTTTTADHSDQAKKKESSPKAAASSSNENRGVYRKTFTRDEMLKIQNQWESKDHKTMMGLNDDSFYIDEGRAGAGRGLIAGVGRWWSKQRQQVQQDELRKRVEEQRLILEQEALRLRNEAYIAELFKSAPEASSVLGDDCTDAAPQHYRRSLNAHNNNNNINHPNHHNSMILSSVATNIDISKPTTTASGIGMTVQFSLPSSTASSSDSSSPGDAAPLEDMVTRVTVEEEPPSDHPFCPYILSPDTMKTIACRALPSSLLFSRWNRLYSLARDGDSFETMLRLVKGADKSLLVIRTTGGEVFGAFADSEWTAQHSSHQGRKFFGGGLSRLFKIVDTHDNTANTNHNNTNDETTTATTSREEVRIYKWTGANRLFQICDSEKKMLAMGGGGIDGAFGLCVQDDFRRGSSGRCETYANEPLSDAHEGSFDILDVEVWGFIAGCF